MHSTFLPLIPSLCNLHHNNNLSAESYAFLKSINTAKVDNLFFYYYFFLFSITEVKDGTWSMVLFSFLNPFCSSAILSFSSAQAEILLQYSLYTTDARLIPLWASGFLGSIVLDLGI